MNELTTVGTAVATVIAILVAVASTGVVAWAGWQYVTAAGDPQALGKAKQTLIGAFIGLGIAGLAFIGPRIFIDLVIKPVGGVSIETEVGLNCDGIFRNQLVFQRGASTKERMNVLVSQIQSQHSDCAEDVWDPLVIADSNTAGKCFDGDVADVTPVIEGSVDDTWVVGDQVVPFSLLRSDGAATPKYGHRAESGRDSGNNIIVYFSDDDDERPSDSASCWMYYARLKQWHENFY